MNRRTALRVVTASVAAPITVWQLLCSRLTHAEQGQLRLGFVGPGSPSTAPRGLQAFWKHLRELGYIEGQNLIVEARWAEGNPERLPQLVSDLLNRKVEILVTYGTAGAVAAKAATSTVPIVGAIMGDPIGSGLAASLARPGGNLTGLSAGYVEGIAGKWLELLHETVPGLVTIAVFQNPENPWHRSNARELERLAPVRHLRVVVLDVRRLDALDRAFEQARKSAQGLVVMNEAFLVASKQRVVALAAKHGLPTLYTLRDFVDAGGLMAYAPDFAVLFRRAAEYVDRIAKGARPADLPIEQPTQLELVVNLRTAKSLGLTIPQPVLARADDVIR
jgi:putative ABC transport system substrate-binding protein